MRRSWKAYMAAVSYRLEKARAAQLKYQIEWATEGRTRRTGKRDEDEPKRQRSRGFQRVKSATY